MSSPKILMVSVAIFIPPIFGQGNVVFDSTPYAPGAFTYSGEKSSTVAFGFRPSQSGPLESIQVPLFQSNSPFGANKAEIDLFAGGDQSIGPSRLLERFSADGRIPIAGDSTGYYPPILFKSSLHPLLDATKEYWVGFSTPANSGVDWTASSTRVDPYFWTGFEIEYKPPGNTSFPKSGAFVVAIVPEPSSGALLTIGVIALLRRAVLGLGGIPKLDRVSRRTH